MSTMFADTLLIVFISVCTALLAEGEPSWARLCAGGGRERGKGRHWGGRAVTRGSGSPEAPHGEDSAESPPRTAPSSGAKRWELALFPPGGRLKEDVLIFPHSHYREDVKKSLDLAAMEV